MKHLALCLLLCAAVLRPTPAPAQAPAPDTAATTAWDGARALELVQRAQLRRQESAADTGLVNYQADARAYLYFYLDRPDAGTRNLVKTDQVALDVLWEAPDQTKQRIVGWRDEKSLPTNIRYHIDHLSVVQENFGDEIRLGDGDEVRGVVHPAAPGAERVYQYRLIDSLTLRLPGAPEPVSVYQLQVRPRDASRPAFVGSVFVDRRSGDLVRMDFTFTAAAYVDRYLDYINISLDNGLWRGRYWLPNQQRVEIRRRIPQLDIPAGSVIRANMRIGDYRFNQELPPGTFAGPPVVAVPRERREAFEFEEDLYAEVREQGLGPQVELDEIRREAARIAADAALRRAERVRLSVPAVSEVLRYNRAEGLALGLGLGFPLPGLDRGRALVGYAFGAERPFAVLSARKVDPRMVAVTSVYANRPRDLGVGPAASGVLGTLGALLAGEDYQDLFFATGLGVDLRRRTSALWSLIGGARLEQHVPAEQEAGFSLFGDFRPVRPATEAVLLEGSVGMERPLPSAAGSGLGLNLQLRGARWWGLGGACASGCDTPDGGVFASPLARALWRRALPTRGAELEIAARAGAVFGDAPRQALFLIGGRGTVPGYPFRAFGGDRFATLQTVASADVASPWLRGRLLGAAGWAGADRELAIRALGAEPTGGLLGSVGVGVGIFYDILRVDLARGLGDGGRWELIVEAAPSFWDFL